MRRTRRLRVTTVRTTLPTSPFSTPLYCPRCQAGVLGVSFAQAGLLLGRDEIGISELVVAGTVHLVSTEGGDARICALSLGTVTP